MRLSVFTACSPWLALDGLIPAVAAAGYDGIEIGLRARAFDPAKPVNFWGNNPAMLDWAKLADEARAARALLDRHRLACPCLGSYASSDEPAHWQAAMAAATILGSPRLRIRVPNYDAGKGYAAQLAEARAAYRDLAALGQAAGVQVLIEIHDRSICPSPSAALRVLEGLDPRHVGVIFEPANMAKEGNEALPMAIDLLGPYLAHVHVKDVRFQAREQAQQLSRHDAPFCPLGQGHLDWPGIVAALDQRAYQGWLSIENFTGLERGLDRLAEDLAWARGIRPLAGS